MIIPTRLAGPLVLLCLFVGGLTGAAAETATPVKVAKRPDGTFGLVRGGSPYLIKGGGGSQHLDALKRAGGNSFRTWGTDNLGPLLDRAQSLGLTVTVGVWLGHPRHGFRYDDEAAVRRQFETTRAAIRQYKNHPAVLVWGLGNEMEGDGKDPKIWRAINDLAKMAHAEDPNHPTMTVIAELGQDNVKVKMVRELCPDVDILGVNSYGGAGSVGERLAKAKFNRPFVLTEFGPRGFWEGRQTSWKAAFEPISTAKAETYKTTYTQGVAGNPGQCLGSYAFLWGNKQEVTSTWFSLFLPSGEKTEAVDVLTEAWTGKPAPNRCPRITAAKFEADGETIHPGDEKKATLAVTDPDGHPVAIRWEVRNESGAHHEGGDRESEPPAVADAIASVQGGNLVLRAPDVPGPYRLYVYVYDGFGGAATANFPFLVAP